MKTTIASKILLHFQHEPTDDQAVVIEKLSGFLENKNQEKVFL